MDEQTQKGETYLRAIVKSAISALFAIGVRSPQNVEKFSNAFQEALEKALLAPLTRPQPVGQAGLEAVSGVAKSSTTGGNATADIKFLIQNLIAQKALRDAGITTVGALISRMRQGSLTKIKGIGKKLEDEIKEAVRRWDSSI